MKFKKSGGTTLVILLTIIVCHSIRAYYVPDEIDYENPEMWVFSDNDSIGNGADIFYIPATWEFDWFTEDSVVSHFADPHNPLHRKHMAIEMNGFEKMMGEGNRFFSPFYRHITLNTWATLDENYIDSLYFAVPFQDAHKAFSHYLEISDNRPFILAGFSQGAKTVVELIKILPDSILNRMVAAYVIGYKVTPEDREVSAALVPAEGEKDTGVVVCYNSVTDVEYIKPIISVPNIACINPVNWKTDSTPAVLDDSITVTLDPDKKVLVVKGYDSSNLKPVLGMINIGDLHSADPWLYQEMLKKNVKTRIESFKCKNNGN